MDPSVDLMRWSLLEIQRLREENDVLRQSAQTFGALAERLHAALQRERSPFARPQSAAQGGNARQR